MEIKIVSEKENLLLKRKEVHFEVKHKQAGSTPARLEIRKGVAKALNTKTDLVFVRKVETKTGTRIAVGRANIYDSPDNARLAEPEYIIERNMPREEAAEKQEGSE